MEKALNLDLKKILIERKVIQKKVEIIGKEISSDFAGKKLIVIAILKGSVIFFADLIREITVPVEIEFLRISSYGSGAESSGKICLEQEIAVDVTGKNVLIVEDIVDSGNTLKFLLDYFAQKGAQSIRSCVLLDKPSRRVVDIKADYICFEVPDDFIVGYGLDYNQKYRNLPYLAILKKECYIKNDIQ